MKTLQKLFFLTIIFILVVGCSKEKTASKEKGGDKDKSWGINHVIDKNHNPSEQKIKISILDSGISKIDELKNSIVYSYNTFDDTEKTNDKYGHGTMIASIIASQTKNSKKVSLNPNVKIFDIQVLDEEGKGSVESVVEGINKSIEKNVDIINLSIGFSNNNIELQKAVNRAIKKGIIVVASTGNTLGYSTDYPAKYEEVISVSAIDRENHIYNHAGKGKVDFVAPGVDIPVINNRSQLDYQSGTSFSTAYISGIISLYLEDKQDVNLKFLEKKSKKLGKAETYGHGLLIYK
ncbi:S8 family serine peptidase [Priestia filamentosa]|uniref:S8 family peptidase n=2 Tax=Priestia filamentosa TaxID=1402861 RepID=UPI001FB343BE|nr:S8 family serine peptidase [Priestia filamentosa]UOE58891.1 S8 family serine peptidase [Priestia filamentosa]